MNAIHLLARTDDTVTMRTVDYEALITAAEDAEDIATLLAAGAREEAIGKAEARADNLSDERVGRLLDGEHPVKIWREHRGLPSLALAEAAGVSCSYLAEIEGGTKPGSVSAYKSLAKALGVSVDDLLY